ELLLNAEQDCGGREARFRIGNPNPLKICCVCGVLPIKSYIGAKRSPAAVVKKHGGGGASSVLVLLLWFQSV
ncbi:hypothetical protein AVEN_192989-1, partial [Araneus ventricosus]